MRTAPQRSEPASLRSRARITAQALAAAFVFMLAVGLTCCAPWRSLEALNLIRDIASGESRSPVDQDTGEPDRLTIAYVVEGRSYVADLYRPGDSTPKAAAVFVPGVVKDGKDDRRLVAFAKSFARMGFLIVVPEITNLRSLVVSASDAQVIADAVRHLVAAGNLSEKKSVGLFAFSYAAGPALIAAMDADIRDTVRFVYAVGPYYSVESVVTYFTTGHYRGSPADPWLKGTPSPYARWVFLRSNAGHVADPRDRSALIAITDRKLTDADADVSDLAKDLGSEGRSVLSLLTNNDPDLVPDLIARLPPAIRREMQALDLSRRDLSALKARLVILHGRTDPMIPYTEGVALAEAAEHTDDLYVLDSLSHVELKLSGLQDFYKLWSAAYVILAERDDMPSPRYVLPSVPSRTSPDFRAQHVRQ